MSTDSTELTFVRCPSCRSLVPAVSTRCRMCGAALDPAVGASKEPAKSGRVRQRTMMESDAGELQEVTEQVRAEENKADAPEPQQASAVEEIPIDDPLSAYIEEVEVEVEEEDSLEQESSELSADAATQSEDEQVSEPELEAEPDFEAETDYTAEAAETSTEEPVQESEVSAAVEEEAVEPDPFDVPVEAEQEGTIESADEEPVENRNGFAASHEPQAVAVEAVSEEADFEEDQGFYKGEETMEEQVETEPTVHAKSASKASDTPEKSEKSSKSAKKASVGGVAGRLFGWLVSYSSPEGESIELREGKFFVTASSLKESDLLLNDESVCTPHALVSASAEGGLRVQDLMSERGVFVRGKDSSAYEKETETVEVFNGDWVRFGDVEFLVSLIPHVGQK